MPTLWTTRGNNFATDELVTAVEHVARRVRREYPGAILGVGDMSQKAGGDSVLHPRTRTGATSTSSTTPSTSAASRWPPPTRCRATRSSTCARASRCRPSTAWSSAPSRRASSTSSATGRWCARCSRTGHRDPVPVHPRALARAPARRGRRSRAKTRRCSSAPRPSCTSRATRRRTTITCTSASSAPPRSRLRLPRRRAGALVEEALQVHGADGAARRRGRAGRRAGPAHRHRPLATRRLT